MEREANYTAVGAFVLLIATHGGLLRVLVRGQRRRARLQALRDLLRGQRLGPESAAARCVTSASTSVASIAIRIDKRASDRVQVIADIDSHTPISKQTLASLSMQGVTGLLYIDLLANAKADASHGIRCPAKHYPVIDSVQSNFDRLLSSLPDLVGRATEVVDRAARVLSDENIKAFSKTMQNIEQTSATLPGAMRDAAVVVAELKATLADVRVAAAGARQLIDTSGPDLAAASERIRAISENLARTTANLDRLMTDHREDLGLFLRDSLPEIERLHARQPQRRAGIPRAVAQPQGRSLTVAVRAELQGRGDSSMTRILAILSASFALTACSGVFESKLAAPQAYVLRLPPAHSASRPPPLRGSVLVQRPRGGTGPRLRSHRAVTQRPAFRFLCRQPLGRAGTRSHRKRDDRCAARHRRVLRGIRRCGAVRACATTCVARCGASKPTTRRKGGGGAHPPYYVALDCTLGRHRDRELLASFTAQGSSVASEDRLNAVVAAFEAATAAAMKELGRADAADALAAEKPPSESR